MGPLTWRSEQRDPLPAADEFAECPAFQTNNPAASVVDFYSAA
jgi:hypothetical protein